MANEKGYRPDGDCTCCDQCGLFCQDGKIPCLGISVGSSTRATDPTTSCNDPGGWDCDDTEDYKSCAPDGVSVELQGQQGSVVERLPDWAKSEDYTPKAETYFCRWSGSLGITPPRCVCHNTSGSCMQSYMCDPCSCYWSDIVCPPGTTCTEQTSCYCAGYIIMCSQNCHEIGCDAGLFDCVTGDCCNILSPYPNDCGIYSYGTCTGDHNFAIGLNGCDWVCDEFTEFVCPGGEFNPFAGQIDVIVYRADNDHVIMAVRFAWANKTYTSVADLGAGPIDCCEIAHVPDLVDTDPFGNPTCCTKPSLSIHDCCGGI